MVPMDVSTTESKSSKSTAPGTELIVARGSTVIVRAIAGLAASTHPAATSTALSFDFMAVTPLDEPPQPPLAWLLKSPVVNLSQGGIFWTTDGYGPEKRALRSAR